MNKFNYLLKISCVLILGACSAQKNLTKIAPDLTLKTQIIGGAKVQSGAAIGSSIVGIYDTEKQFTCTGTLLANNVILTAAHCVESSASKIRIVFGTELMTAVLSHEISKQESFVRAGVSLKVHPDWNQEANKTKNTDWHDLALIKFSGSVPEGYKPASFLQDISVLVKGAYVSLAGYGVTNVDVQQINPKKYKNIDQAIENEEVVCDDEKRSHCYKMDFQGNDELYETKAPISGLTETEVRLDESIHGTCVGDSGGPAFIEKDGQYYIFGITSRGSFSCDGTGVYTNAVIYRPWIEATIKSL
ncbi:MAG: trypsin-like serine protease [Pseudobdellovibrio sp.]